MSKVCPPITASMAYWVRPFSVSSSISLISAPAASFVEGRLDGFGQIGQRHLRLVLVILILSSLVVVVFIIRFLAEQGPVGRYLDLDLLAPDDHFRLVDGPAVLDLHLDFVDGVALCLGEDRGLDGLRAAPRARPLISSLKTLWVATAPMHSAKPAITSTPIIPACFGFIVKSPCKTISNLLRLPPCSGRQARRHPSALPDQDIRAR